MIGKEFIELIKIVLMGFLNIVADDLMEFFASSLQDGTIGYILDQGMSEFEGAFPACFRRYERHLLQDLYILIQSLIAYLRIG